MIPDGKNGSTYFWLEVALLLESNYWTLSLFRQLPTLLSVLLA
jgi:hypothetical protein